MVKIPCEIMTKNVLPYVRSQIARELVGVHNLSQIETARRMGITQAAVSWYISNKRAIRLPSINGNLINDKNVKKIFYRLQNNLLKHRKFNSTCT